MALLFLLGRIILGGFFLKNAYAHLTNSGPMAEYAATKGIKAGKTGVVLSGLLILVAGLSILLGVWPQVGIWSGIVFLLSVTPTMHAFWKISDPHAKAAEKIQFSKNLAILGGLLMLLMLPAASWPYTLPW